MPCASNKTSILVCLSWVHGQASAKLWSVFSLSQVYELANAKNHPARIALLKEWQKGGGIMIMGYQLFRILANYNGKSKKTKTAFHESLIDPGMSQHTKDN